MARQPGGYPGFCSIKRLEVFLPPLDGMLVHCRVTPSIEFAGTHLYTWVERSTVKVKCLAQEHNAMSPARARTRTARSGDERTNQRPPRLPMIEVNNTCIHAFSSAFLNTLLGVCILCQHFLSILVRQKH